MGLLLCFGLAGGRLVAGLKRYRAEFSEDRNGTPNRWIIDHTELRLRKPMKIFSNLQSFAGAVVSARSAWHTFADKTEDVRKLQLHCTVDRLHTLGFSLMSGHPWENVFAAEQSTLIDALRDLKEVRLIFLRSVSDLPGIGALRCSLQ